MFGALKKKLSKFKERIVEAISKREAEEVVEPAPQTVRGEEREVPPAPIPPPKPEKEAKIPEQKVEGTVAEQTTPQPTEVFLPSPEKPKRVVKRAIKRLLVKRLSPQDVDDIMWDLEVALLESDVALPVANHILEKVRSELTARKISIRDDPRKIADEILRSALHDVLTPSSRVDLLSVIRSKKSRNEPAVLVFVGINGHGKTTTIAKLAKYLKDRGFKVVLAAGDTFRAAAIEQLEIHAQRLNVPLIKQKRGADSAAVAYDAIAFAKARGYDVVLVDTAGRMQTNRNLMDEMRKIVRVAKPDLVLFVGDALTGNDAVEQAKAFDEAVGIHGSILCKMDADARGGAALSISYVTGKPILFLGTGQGYDDLVEFKPELVINSLLGD